MPWSHPLQTNKMSHQFASRDYKAKEAIKNIRNRLVSFQLWLFLELVDEPLVQDFTISPGTFVCMNTLTVTRRLHYFRLE